MSHCARTDPAVIPHGRSPEQVIAAWPDSSPLAALTSGTVTGQHARWTILALPKESVSGYPVALEAASGTTEGDHQSTGIPFTGGWIGWIAYETGGLIEPTAMHTPQIDSHAQWPCACLLRCPGAYIHDASIDQWWTVGETHSLPALDWEQPDRIISDNRPGYTVGPLSSLTGKDRYVQDATRVIELIHAGDAFQVNLAHHLTARFLGDARQCFLDLVRSTSPWFGAYIERPDGLGAICSLSPELFLKADLSSGDVMTRPIKGTRPDSSDAAELRQSEKDAAELAMIVDLMRNDLGRICEYGSVRVTDPVTIERHAKAANGEQSTGVLHGVATVEGSLREHVGLIELLDATFPPGSVTGAPKVRAMQIIDEFEQRPRGPYCGAIGFISDSGQVEMNVAIRTATILGRRLDANRLGQFEGQISFPVGAGLVADSNPEAEWRETLDKAAAFVSALNGAPNNTNS